MAARAQISRPTGRRRSAIYAFACVDAERRGETEVEPVEVDGDTAGVPIALRGSGLDPGLRGFSPRRRGSRSGGVLRPLSLQ